MTKGAFVRVDIDQAGVDITATVSRIEQVFDSFERGTEIVAFIAPQSGDYRLTARASSPGAVLMTLYGERAPEPADLALMRANSLSAEARRLVRAGNGTDLRAALDRDIQALQYWRESRAAEQEMRAAIHLGNTLHALGRRTEAIERFEATEDGARRLGSPELLAELHNSAGLCRLESGQIEAAREELARALAEWDQAGDLFGQAATATNLGLLAWQTGEFADSLVNYRRALRRFRSVHSARGVAMALNNVALTYASMGDYGRAAGHLREARALLLKLADRRAAGRALVNIGRAYLGLGQPAIASRMERRALVELAALEDEQWVAEAETALGRAECAQGHPEAGIPLYRSALSRYEGLRDKRGQAIAHHYLGVALADRGAMQEASKELARAYELRREEGRRDVAAESLYELARIDARNGDLPTAAARLQEAAELTELVRIRTAAEPFQDSYFATRAPYYELWIEVLIRGGFFAQAFEVCERARARSLVDALVEGKQRLRPAKDDAFAARERQVLHALNYAIADLPRTGTSQTSVQQRRVDELLDEYRNLQGEIRLADPHYADLLRPPIATVGEVQGALDADTSLIEFWIGGEQSQVWVLSRSELHCFPLPPRRQIENMATQYVGLVAGYRERQRASDASARMAASELRVARYLLGPVQPYLRKRVLIVPDGSLNYVPFAALPIPGGGRRLLGDAHELTWLPSSSAMLILKAREVPRPDGTLAILADPVFDAADPRVQPAVSGTRLPRLGERPLPRLPFSRKEADAIAALAPAAGLLKAEDFEASKGLAISGRLSGYRFVHFATHAVIDDVRPELSSIVLSLVDRHGRRVDGQLRLFEVAGLKLSAELAVISACQTAAGRMVRGEGIIGLTRGFLYAGAARTLVSAWAADDEATAELLRLTYKEMLGPARLRPSAALAAAQRTLRSNERWRDPYFWGNFRVLGDWR